MNLKIILYSKQQIQVIFKRFLPITGKGGIIALDKFENISFSYNTDGMFRGYADEDGNIKTYIYECK